MRQARRPLPLMTESIANILTPGLAIEKFREIVASTDGSFPFDMDDMVELGEKYLELYPDCFSNRNCQHVQYGYQMVRACIVEKLVKGYEPALKDAFRAMFNQIPLIDEKVAFLVSSQGPENARRLCEQIVSRLYELKSVIDMIPTGMVKERFVGGITQIFNVSYLINMSLDSHLSG